ncbi:SulP family inorganic anion transporter [Desulfobaculum bizertense]|uniref:SulP family inorganic anion transporter n=1 Tax=Desulfobaculum bizertense TaxID=376490 RepID=UPI001F332FE8|nr:SulP family inorganic anion transporter [Desulfobaculum bizertense]UIJ36953.1 SulP family inorganic anion transporter [Desulfobaculum bizertense]
MLTRIFPFLSWIKGYGAKELRADFTSGLTVALVLIPQSMAYAQLAGLPAYYGLYASFLPPMIAALFGSSRQLATGPVAVVSLMTAASLEPLATAGSEAFVVYAILLAFTVGLFQFLLGALRLGLVVNFLSHPVVNGFTNAAALIIATSQLSKLFGVYVDKAAHHYETIIRVVEAAVDYTHWPTLLMAILAFVIMIGLKRLAPKVPNVLVAVVITTLLSWAIGFEHNTTADLSTVQSTEAQQAVQEFNNIIHTIPVLGEKRTELNGLYADAVQNQGLTSIPALDYKHDIEVVNIRIENLKHKAHAWRARLRHMKFAGVEQGNSIVFYDYDAVPDGLTTDGRLWRIKVGNKELKTDSLKMMGGGAVVGVVPSGLPSFTVPKLDLGSILQLLPYAAIISLLGFMEAISIAKAMAAKTGQRLDPNQELIGQGLANMVGAIGKSYPASGSFSRSAVNLASGAVTGLSSVFTSLVVLIVLMFFTPLLYHLPQSVLASVIMMAVIGLLNVHGFIHAWKAQWYDGAISIITFLCTLGFAPHLDKGIMVGVVLSLGVFLYKSMRPTVAALSMSPEKSLRDSAVYGLKECEHVAVIRFDGPLFFANASYLEDRITDIIQTKRNLRHILLVANGINDMDASGEEALSLIVKRVRSAGYGMSLSGVNEKVMSVMERTHLLESIGEENIYETQAEALPAIHAKAHEGSDEKECPLTEVCPI